MSFKEDARDFLNQNRIAVVGVSREKDATGNIIFRALQERGYTVIPVHPRLNQIDDVTCYPNLKSIPGQVDGVIVVTRPEITDKIMLEAVTAKIPRVWMHYNPLFGKQNSSVHEGAVHYGRKNGITVIDGGCPMMFLEFGHKCMRVALDVMNKLPA